MLRALGSAEYGELVAWWNSEPRGERRGDWQAAAIAAWGLAPHTKDHRPPPLSNVVLSFEPRKVEQQSQVDMMEICRQIAERCNT